MYRSLLVVLVFLLVFAPVFGQSSGTDPQTLQAILGEVRQLRHDLQTTTIASQRAEILLYRLQSQEAVVARASQRLDEARTKLAETQANRARTASDIKQNEDFISANGNSSTDLKGIEDSVTALRASLGQLQIDEQQRQTREMEAEDQLRVERAKLADLQMRLDKIDAALERSSQQLATSPR